MQNCKLDLYGDQQQVPITRKNRGKITLKAWAVACPKNERLVLPCSYNRIKSYYSIYGQWDIYETISKLHMKALAYGVTPNE